MERLKNFKKKKEKENGIFVLSLVLVTFLLRRNSEISNIILQNTYW